MAVTEYPDPGQVGELVERSVGVCVDIFDPVAKALASILDAKLARVEIVPVQIRLRALVVLCGIVDSGTVLGIGMIPVAFDRGPARL